MKESVFFKAFYFTQYRYDRYHHTDASSGASSHFIGMMESGSCRIVSQDVTIEAGPSEPFYIPMGLPYQSYWFSSGMVRLRSYGFKLFPEMESVSFRLQKLPTELAEPLRQIPLMGRPDSAALGALFSLLGQAMPQMERSSTESSVCVWEQAVSYMQEHMECTVAEVARYCNVSESALYASFKRHGSTPNRTRQELLAKEAKHLLTTTDLPVQEISDRLGFSSSSYFRKVLFAQTGKIPTQIRKNAVKV